MKPIIFVLGLSGAGKDEASKMLEERCSLLRKDKDRKGDRGFQIVGFPAEWDRDISLVDFAFLASSVRGWLGDQHQGAVLSFPTTYRFSRPTFEMYERAEYREFRAEAFEPDESRPSLENLLARMLEQLANQGIELTAGSV